MSEVTEVLSSKADLAPIFLHTSWRTGGTALAFAFREQEECTLFYEPINVVLQNPEKAFLASPERWNSRHPASTPYFSEFKPFVSQDNVITNLPDLSLFTFEYPSQEWQAGLSKYLHMLVDNAQRERKIPVFKFTNLEGHLEFLRSEFPSATNIAINRGRDEQLLSWFSQAANGNYEFFKAGWRTIDAEGAMPFVGTMRANPLSDEDISNLIRDFNRYRDLIDHFHFQMDIVINISPEATLDPSALLEFVEKHHPSQLHIWVSALGNLKNERPGVLASNERLQKSYIRSIKLSREIELKDREIERKNREIKNLEEKYERVINSSSWKMTQPWRKFGSVLKRPKS